MPSDRSPDGLLLVDKQAGWTSHDVVAKVRRLAGTKKVGHAGTLDPMATGVLVLGLGRATRLLSYLAANDKAYAATMRLGRSTTTDDAEGELLSKTSAQHLTQADVERAVSRWVGPISQVPSAVSAVKVDGKRSYALVRAGEDVDLAARPVVVSTFVVEKFRPHDDAVDVDVLVECSSGTYVRALARDIGNDLGVGGHVTSLRRTRSGAFDVSETRSLDQLGAEEQLPLVSLAETVRSLFPQRSVDAQEAALVRHGRPMALDGESSIVGVFDASGDVLALMEPRDGELRVKVGFTGS
jgi:tRNA pseudouridine55 synthase